MQNLKLSVGILCLFICFGLQSQVNGYQGKRLFADINFCYGPALKGPTKNGKAISDGDLLAANTKLKFGVGYSLFRYMNIRLEYDQFTTSYYDRFPYNNRELLVLNSAKVMGTAIAIDFISKESGRWGLAPLGFSYGFALEFGKATPELGFRPEDDYSEEFKMGARESIELTSDNFTLIGFRISNRTIISDHIVLTSGINTFLPLGKEFITAFKGFTGNQVDSDLMARVAGNYLFDIQIGIGYLIF